MRQGQRNWDEGQIGRLYAVLDRHLPEPGQADLRGWEWYYLLSRCYQDVLTFREHQHEVYSVAWSPDGRRIVSAGRNRCKVWDAVSGTEVHSVDHGFDTRCVAWSPDGKRIAEARGRDGFALVWDAETGEKQLTIRKTKKRKKFDYHLSIAWSPDGKRLVWGGFPPVIYDAKTGEELFALQGHERGPVHAVAWSPDGKHLASAGGDKKLIVWDGENSQEIKTITGHNTQLYAVAWSPDGKRLASAGQDGSTHVWDVASGEKLHSLVHPTPVDSLAFSPDARYLALGTRNSQVIVWDVPALP